MNPANWQPMVQTDTRTVVVVKSGYAVVLYWNPLSRLPSFSFPELSGINFFWRFRVFIVKIWYPGTTIRRAMITVKWLTYHSISGIWHHVLHQISTFSNSNRLLKELTYQYNGKYLKLTTERRIKFIYFILLNISQPFCFSFFVSNSS